MPVEVNVTPAVLQRIRWVNEGDPPTEVGRPFTVQFNPQTLSLSHSNQHAANGSDETASQRMQRAASKLNLDLLFDVNSPQPDGQSSRDVRELTAPLLEVLKAGREPGGGVSNAPLLGLRFEWNTFKFDGIVDSINETIDFFSHEGVPLRSQLSMSLTERKTVEEEDTGADSPSAPGTQARTAAPGGASLQGMLGSAGNAWKAAATLNGIENPRLLQAGVLLNLNAGAAGVVAGALGPVTANLQIDARGRLKFP